MYAIETDLGRFEAATERDAKRQLRKAQAINRREQGKRDAQRSAATTAAAAQGYTFYSRFLSGDACPPAWLSYRPGGYGYKVARIIETADGGNELVIDTPHGPARLSCWRLTLTAVIIDGGGWATAIELQHADGQPAELFAVGTSGDVASIVPIKGIPIDWFRWGKE